MPQLARRATEFSNELLALQTVARDPHGLPQDFEESLVRIARDAAGALTRMWNESGRSRALSQANVSSQAGWRVLKSFDPGGNQPALGAILTAAAHQDDLATIRQALRHIGVNGQGTDRARVAAILDKVAMLLMESAEIGGQAKQFDRAHVVARVSSTAVTLLGDGYPEIRTRSGVRARDALRMASRLRPEDGHTVVLLAAAEAATNRPEMAISLLRSVGDTNAGGMPAAIRSSANDAFKALAQSSWLALRDVADAASLRWERAAGDGRSENLMRVRSRLICDLQAQRFSEATDTIVAVLRRGAEPDSALVRALVGATLYGLVSPSGDVDVDSAVGWATQAAPDRPEVAEVVSAGSIALIDAHGTRPKSVVAIRARNALEQIQRTAAA